MQGQIDDDIADIADAVSGNVWTAWIAVAVALAATLLLALVVSWVFSRVMRSLGRRHRAFEAISRRFTRPLFWLLTVIGWKATFAPFMPEGFEDLTTSVDYGLTLALIAVFGWVIAKVLIFFVDAAMVKPPSAGADEFALRRRRTQIRMIRRLVIALVTVLTIAAMLLTIPGARTFGASLLASAGVASIVAGLAAQSTLGNLIAGLQLAFSNALKVGDTVEVSDQFGTVEEITLTYVVVQIWDDRRLVLPSTYFTTTPYINWTRNQTQLTGTVYLEADFTIDVEAVRRELETIVDGSPDWDRRSWGLVVTDAVGGVAQLRASMTAADGDALWNLRCEVREKLMAFVASQRPHELARQRVAVERPAE
ncbi:mechanosensitive ion channel family protein [Microbacterium sp. gxy059]|uniref:mechanosensitive ion channel family protein n=1 Tax=Microbacterium sp. gxy059 TaxID=2957199 RepID=UPI003D95F277